MQVAANKKPLVYIIVLLFLNVYWCYGYNISLNIKLNLAQYYVGMYEEIKLHAYFEYWMLMISKYSELVNSSR